MKHLDPDVYVFSKSGHVEMQFINCQKYMDSFLKGFESYLVKARRFTQRSRSGTAIEVIVFCRDHDRVDYSLIAKRVVQKRRDLNRRLLSQKSGRECGKYDIEALYALQQGLCYYTGEVLCRTRFHVDHLVPLCMGGTNAPINRVLCTPLANRKKGFLDKNEYLRKIHPGGVPNDAKKRMAEIDRARRKMFLKQGHLTRALKRERDMKAGFARALELLKGLENKIGPGETPRMGS